MTTPPRSHLPRRRLLAAGAGLALAAPYVARGQAALTPVLLHPGLGLPGAAVLLACWRSDRGYFRDEGLNVTIDRGFGSGDTPTRAAAGASRFRRGRRPPVIRMRLTNPGVDLITPFVLHAGQPAGGDDSAPHRHRPPAGAGGQAHRSTRDGRGAAVLPGAGARRRARCLHHPLDHRHAAAARTNAGARRGGRHHGLRDRRACSACALSASIRPTSCPGGYSAFGVVLLSTALQVAARLTRKPIRAW